jgi:hydroxypyruvate reductase
LAIALAHRGAHRVGTFAISDVIGDDPSVIGSGPCSPDPLDASDFLALVDAHDMRTRLERAVTIVLGLEGAAESVAVPAADDPAFARVDYELVAGNRDALEAMEAAARHAGISHVARAPMPLEGAAETLGDLLVQQALDVATHAATKDPVLLLHGGEPVVHLRDTVERAMAVGDADEPLRGGRMQVLALSAALALEAAAMRGDAAAWRVSVLAAGTDGRDGPTDAAGAIVDAAVPALARRHGRTPEGDLATGRSWFSLDAAEALLRTGPTGTNVMDVVALLVR